MKEFLYHGSVVPNITELSANAKSYDGKHRIVYLTDCLPYSLFYIWDSKHNLKTEKHVTCWIKDGIVYYEEQFENQLRRFYDGVNGYVYVVNKSDDFRNISERESMWYSDKNVSIATRIYIFNVYQEMKKYICEKKIKVISYEEADKKRLNELYKHISNRIIKDNLLNTPQCENALFYRTFFAKAWDDAKRKGK